MKQEEVEQIAKKSGKDQAEKVREYRKTNIGDVDDPKFEIYCEEGCGNYIVSDDEDKTYICDGCCRATEL